MTVDSQTKSLRTIHKMIYPSIPEDRNWQAEFGILAIRHEYLKYEHQMTYKSLKNLSIEKALEKTKYWGYAKLRNKIEELAKDCLNDDQTLTLLKNLLNRAKGYTDKRNDYIHSLYGHELDGGPDKRSDTGDWGPIPTIKDLRNLHTEIYEVTDEFRNERLNGILFKAIQKIE